MIKKGDENEIYLKWKWIKLNGKEIGRKKGSVKRMWNVKILDELMMVLFNEKSYLLSNS